MKMQHRWLAILIILMTSVVIVSERIRADMGTCGGVSTTVPFMDVGGSIFFCQIAEAYFSGLTNGTTSTTYSPSNPVTRDQMAAFITRTMDQSLKRGSRRAALGQWWTANHSASSTVGNVPQGVQSDGADLWVANNSSGTVSRVRASDARLLDTWTGAIGASSVLVAEGGVFVTGYTAAKLYCIDPTSAAGVVSVCASGLGTNPSGLTTDGTKIWTANNSGSVSIIDTCCASVTTVSTGFTHLGGILFDGTNIWVADFGDNQLKKLDSSGAILTAVNVGASPFFPVFDGTNIWMPNFGDNSITVVRAATSAVIATLTGNGLNSPVQAAFDGERIVVTNNGGLVVSLWKASDLTPLGTLGLGGGSWGACSDGIKLWVVAQGSPGSVKGF
jgi:S-layer homology domain